MELTIFAGKGGVGKSTSAAIYSVSKSWDGSVLAIDYDGGHSLHRVLSMEAPRPNVPVNTPFEGLELMVVDPLEYTSIHTAQFKGVAVQDYLSQFPENYGLVPFCDMITTFFGAPTDIDTVSKFSTLVEAYEAALESGVEHLVVDVEPTAGLLRMLDSVDSITRSLNNLAHPPLIARVARSMMLQQWPDIGAFIHGDYIGNADVHIERISGLNESLRRANYFLVTTPESSPVQEMISLQEQLLEREAIASAIVVNNVRGETYEESQFAELRKRELPIITIQNDSRLVDEDSCGRLGAITELGKKFS